MSTSIEALKSKVVQSNGLARPNRFMIELPRIGSVGMDHMNVLCRAATMPGKQIATADRRIGMEFEKVAYGYAVDDVPMTFLMLNDYSVKKYFDAWRNAIIDENTHQVGYKENYQAKVVIHQLSEGIPSFFIGANFKLGPISIKGGKSINIPGIQMRNTVYSVELIDAFPTTIGQIDFNNEQDGIVEFNVVFSYTNWRRSRSSQFTFSF